MTLVGAGGVRILRFQFLPRFKREFRKLSVELQDDVRRKLDDLLADPRPPGLAFEKLKGYRKPDIYTIHVTGNYKISLEISGCVALLRRVANHNDIDRRP